jgi:hypothetical protein
MAATANRDCSGGLLLLNLHIDLSHIFSVDRSMGRIYRPNSSKYFSTSNAAMQPVPAAVMAWR